VISGFVQLLKPLFLPLLKLKLEPPHLPEGVTLVRHLKPAEAWLGLKYAGVLLGFSVQLFVLSSGLVAALAARNTEPAIALGVILSFLVLGLVASLVTTRIDFELRHYLVGDRSLRVSQGAVIRREVTLSYANVQNIEVVQGPLERLFGIKSVTISTAGGAAVAGAHTSHQVVLAGITDADAVRELILGMVKQHRDAGLGEAQHAKQPDGLDPRLLEEIRDAALALRDAAVKRAASP
jgi:membrane protein YdbS with pleckstrin-like domain